MELVKTEEALNPLIGFATMEGGTVATIVAEGCPYDQAIVLMEYDRQFAVVIADNGHLTSGDRFDAKAMQHYKVRRIPHGTQLTFAV